MSSHSFLPPSGASAWSRCAMWPLMNQRYPQDNTVESLEGTAAHWVLSEMLALRVHREGTLAPNGVMVTGEMLDGAELAQDTIGHRMRAPLVPLHLEEQVRIPEIHPDCFGTPDIWAFTIGNAHLEIIDYKFGHGFVDEWWNPQGLLYMLGIVNQITAQGLTLSPLNISVSFTIVQPRCFYRGAPVRTHSYVVKDAAERIVDLQKAAVAAMDPQPMATTGRYCDHCPGRTACPALQEASYHDAEFANGRQPHDLTPEAAGRELRMLERAWERLGARVDGLRELTLANLKAGKRVPDYKIDTSSKGRTRWNVPAEQIITLGQMFGKDLSKPEVITPAQAIKKGVDAAVISAYSSITPGSLKLVPDNNAEASRVFGTGE